MGQNEIKLPGHGHTRLQHSRMPVSSPLVDSVWTAVDTFAGLELPSRLMIAATRPAMWGVAIEVPEMLFVAWGCGKRDVRHVRRARISPGSPRDHSH